MCCGKGTTSWWPIEVIRPWFPHTEQVPPVMEEPERGFLWHIA